MLLSIKLESLHTRQLEWTTMAAHSMPSVGQGDRLDDTIRQARPIA